MAVEVRNPRMYMNPWSSGSPKAWAPASTARPARSSTCSRLSADRPTMTSRLAEVSAIACGAMKLSKNGSTTSITDASSLTTIRVAFSSVNCSSNEKPSRRKNSIARGRSFTGRLTNVFMGMVGTLSLGNRLS
jgi:hypothetical protein